MSNSNLIPSVLTSPDPETFQKYLEEEKAHGIDYQVLEKSYYFPFEDPNSVTSLTTQQNLPSYHKTENIFIHPSYITPSQKTKMTPTEELHLRIIGAEMIKEAGYSLRLPWYSILTGQNLFQRFFTRVSFLEYDVKEIVMACVFLGAKLEESHRKVRDVVSVCYHVFKVRSGATKPIPALSLSSNYYQMMRQAIVECERYVLKELGFELYRLSEHPHRYLLYFLKPLRPSPETIQKAWNYCNDCFLNTLCINYPPHVVAASCLYLAIRTTNSPMVRPIWWAIFETSIKHILDVSAELMKLYEQPKLTFTNVKEIIEAYHKRNNIDREYIIDNEAEFEKNQKIQQEEEAKLRAPVEKEKPKSGPAQSTDQKKDRKPDNKPQDDRKGDHRPRKSDYLDKYRNDKKKRKKHSRSRDRKRSYSSDSSSSDSESDRKKKKKKKSKRDRSSSSSEDRSSSRKKSRKDSSKRSSSRRKDKKKKDSRDRKQKKDRSRDRSRDKKYSNPPKLGRKNSLEMISDQIKENTIKERERYNQELEKKRTDKVTDENEEESFLKKAEKKPTTSKPTIPSISLEGLKAAALEKATQEENFSMSFVKSLQTEEFMRFEEKRSEAATIKAEEIKSSEQEPLKEQKNGNGKAHGEDDELDEERLAELRKKIAENKNKKKRFP